MHHRRTLRRFAIAVTAVSLFLGAGAPVAQAKDDKARSEENAHHALQKARKAQERKLRRTPAITEAKGAVTKVDAATRTFELQVSEANQAGLRGKKLAVVLAPQAYVALRDRTVTLADIRVGDTGKVMGLLDAGKLTAYIARFDRKAPAPTTLTGKVTSVTPLTLLAKGFSTPIQMTSPSAVWLGDDPVTVADIRVGDTCTAVGIPTPTSLAAVFLACKRG